MNSVNDDARKQEGVTAHPGNGDLSRCQYYVAVYRPGHVRDAQYHPGTDARADAWDDPDWQDARGGELYINVFAAEPGETEADVLRKVTSAEGCSAEAIRLIRVGAQRSRTI